MRPTANRRGNRDATPRAQRIGGTEQRCRHYEVAVRPPRDGNRPHPVRTTGRRRNNLLLWSPPRTRVAAARNHGPTPGARDRDRLFGRPPVGIEPDTARDLS